MNTTVIGKRSNVLFKCYALLILTEMKPLILKNTLMACPIFCIESLHSLSKSGFGHDKMCNGAKSTSLFLIAEILYQNLP